MEDLKDMGVEAFETYLDVTDLKSVENFAEFTIKCFGRVDMLINNAGIAGARGRIDKVDVLEAKKIFDVNFFGVWHGCAVFSKKIVALGSL